MKQVQIYIFFFCKICKICVALMRARPNSVVFKYNIIWCPITYLVIRFCVFLCTVKTGRGFLVPSTRPLNSDRGNTQEIETSNLLEREKLIHVLMTQLAACLAASSVSEC